MYNKANKATLGELNKQHEIVKLLSTSLNKSHAKGVEVTKKLGLPLKVIFFQNYILNCNINFSRIRWWMEDTPIRNMLMHILS